MTMTKNDDSLFDFKLKNITGEVTELSSYRGKVLLFVNTASECGFTPQYEELQELHEEYFDKGLLVLGFPANNFGGQEPGNDQQIQTFCKSRFGVTFPLFSKISVAGDDIHPLFAWLIQQPCGGASGSIKWNFEKFLINRDGELVHRYRSVTKPSSKKLREKIEELL